MPCWAQAIGLVSSHKLGVQSNLLLAGVLPSLLLAGVPSSLLPAGVQPSLLVAGVQPNFLLASRLSWLSLRRAVPQVTK